MAIGVAPELCLSPRAARALAGRPARAEGRGHQPPAPGRGGQRQRRAGRRRRPTRRCCSTRAPARSLVRQRKVHPFNFSQEDLELWGLDGSPHRPDRRGPEPRRARLRGRGGRRAAGDPRLRGPGSAARLAPRAPRARRVADPGAGVRPPDQGPALGALAGRGLQRRHRLERRGGQQPGDRRDPPHSRRRSARRSPSRPARRSSGTPPSPTTSSCSRSTATAPRVAHEQPG